jgi:hypothetical protein
VIVIIRRVVGEEGGADLADVRARGVVCDFCDGGDVA